MNLYFLDHSYSWWGQHAGFGLLSKILALQGYPVSVVRPRRGIAARLMGKAYSTLRGSPKGNQRMAAAEMEFLLRMRAAGASGHVLYLEDHLEMLQRGGGSRRWIGTIHLPRRLWDARSLEALRDARGALVLCDRFREDFSNIIPASRLRVVLHGVDTTFYRPGGLRKTCDVPRLLFVGAWLRNTRMLSRLVPWILKRFPDVVFDLVVPMHARKDSALTSLQANPAVHWHCGLTDEELRLKYQTSTLLFMPMEDSGANNAIIEALACGLPVVTTDVGGIRNYGGESVFSLVANNDDEGCLNLLEQYLTNAELRQTVGKACRAFAEERLEWAVVAKEYIRAYEFFGLSSGRP
jgi:glycosyltransferase involved in cell wall biosynthesis